METRDTLFGRCACGGDYTPTLVEVRFSGDDGSSHTIPNVPQAVCPDCGARVYKAAALEQIETGYAAFKIRHKSSV